MQAEISVKCAQCHKKLGKIKVDTFVSADMPDGLWGKIQLFIIRHREECRYYGSKG